MKKLILAAAIAAKPLGAVAGDVALFAGLSWTFGDGGGKPGFTMKALSDDEADTAAFTAGVTYNFDGTFGCDAGLA